MNKDNAKSYLPFVQALAEGKTIQWNKDGKWVDLERLSFNDTPENYRIKLEPREFWMNEYENGRGCTHDSEEEAVAAAGYSVARVAVHYREVIE